MKIVAKTDTGLVRTSNQDSYAAGELPGSVAWAVVCDGMGGTAGGNLASSMAVKLISERISSSYRSGMSGVSIKNMLTSAILAANINIYEAGQKDAELTGMGTTVVVAIMAEESVYIAHVGDSRAYTMSGGKLHQLTKDHSFVQEMVDSGKLTPDEAKDDPRKNLITRALGVNENVRIDFCQEYISDDEFIILCTDGLTNYVETSEIYELTADGSFNDYAERLVNRANENGGGDNITVVTMSY
ncbi:MAG: Stp1/IreP family PP2C-type Ser/Thr phosphatase [Clostridia bacterium]|nr:Stp1/IreP family PP2C-type Ser/Thr phosphatase [Clostridia bacterium]